MNKKILSIAKKKFKKLAKHYRQFNVVFLDNWRGLRFIYDVAELHKFRGRDFHKSELYELLKNEKPGRFSANLHKASRTDKKLYGPNPFLNCKTFREYCDAYVNFLLNKTNDKRQIIRELGQIKDMRIIYAKDGNEKDLENKFRGLLIRKTLKKASPDKKTIIRGFVKKNQKYFT